MNKEDPWVLWPGMGPVVFTQPGAKLEKSAIGPPTKRTLEKAGTGSTA